MPVRSGVRKSGVQRKRHKMKQTGVAVGCLEFEAFVHVPFLLIFSKYLFNRLVKELYNRKLGGCSNLATICCLCYLYKIIII